jgi:hypothetical protein
MMQKEKIEVMKETCGQKENNSKRIEKRDWEKKIEDEEWDVKQNKSMKQDEEETMMK